jgi:glycosyltransferase involved in cell wall biosynthesis
VRVLMVTPHDPLGMGGVERHVRETSTRLAARGVRVEVLYVSAHGRGGERCERGVPIRAVRSWPAGSDWGIAPGLWREIAAGRFDLVHVQSYHTLVAPLAMARALSLRIPYCLTFHAGGHSSWWRNHVRGIQLRALAPLLRRAACLVALARFEVELYAGALGLPRERFALIPNGVDPLPVPPGGEEPPPTLASIGRLERYKGHHRVIAAMPTVLERWPQARLRIVGEGPYERQLRRLARRFGVDASVQFTAVPAGDREGMAALLSEVRLVVLLSEFETQPLVGLEAAAAGRRLLVADRAGLGELAADGLARAVPLELPPVELGCLIVDELAQPMPASRPALVSWEECAERLLELYCTLVG